MLKRFLLVLFSLFFLTACESPRHFAPVINLSHRRVKKVQPKIQSQPQIQAQPQIKSQPQIQLQPKLKPKAVATGSIGQWAWPAKGKIIQGFSSAYGGNKGLDIAGKLGDNIRATAAGRVVYCGTGLRSYGLLILIKHNAKYLSAYAHNSKSLVKEGQKVKQGQVIAKMGNSDAKQVMLHFEIRRSGKPVDPLTLLPPQK